MADSIFVILNKIGLPDEAAVTDRFGELGCEAELDADWSWGTLVGWLPASYLGDESGFEAICDNITPGEKSDFSVSGRPDLDFLVEITPRGGPRSYACAMTFAAAAAICGDGVIALYEGPNISAGEAAAWLVEETEDVATEIQERDNKAKLKATLSESGRPPEEVLDQMLSRLIGQTIVFHNGLTLFRTEDQSTIRGSRCQLSSEGTTQAVHGHWAMLKDDQCRLLREPVADTDQLALQLRDLDSRAAEAERKDRAATDLANEIMEQWPGAVSVRSVSRVGHLGLRLETSNHYLIEFTARDNFSIISIDFGDLSFGLNGFRVVMT